MRAQGNPQHLQRKLRMSPADAARNEPAARSERASNLKSLSFRIIYELVVELRFIKFRFVSKVYQSKSSSYKTAQAGHTNLNKGHCTDSERRLGSVRSSRAFFGRSPGQLMARHAALAKTCARRRARDEKPGITRSPK